MISRPAGFPACALFLLLGAANGVSAQSCDRACLRTALDQYLSAVIKHDPAAAPLFVGFRQTENAVVVRPGTGMWKTMTALGKLQRRYLDPVSGQAAYFGIVEEGAALAIVTVRVKVDDRKISEAEWLIARKGDPGLNGPQQPGQPAGNFFDPDALTAGPPPDTPIAKAGRISRNAMIAVTNSYFDGITSHDGSIIMAHPGCSRIENGFTVTNRAGGPGGGGDCAANLANINVQMVAARRYPLVDEEAGVVLAIAIFIRKPGTTTRRNVLSEWFVIDQSKIRSVYSAMFYPSPELPAPNWPPYDGNWPLPPSLAVPAPPAPSR